jgi:hypothetical protein
LANDSNVGDDMKTNFKSINWNLVIVLLFLCALMIPIIPGGYVMASNVTGAIWHGVLTVANNNTAATLVSSNSNVTSAMLAGSGYMAAGATDTAVTTSTGTDVAYMPSNNATWIFWEPSIGGPYNYDSYNLYTGGTTTGGKIRWFPGAGGGTRLDNALLELGNNFTIEQRGYVDASKAGEYLVQKPGAINLYLSAANTITLMLNAGAPSVSLPITSDEYIIRASSDGANLILYYEGYRSDYDLNNDGYVNATDSDLIDHWILFHGAVYRSDYDINGNGIISIVDSTLLNLWIATNTNTSSVGTDTVTDNGNAWTFDTNYVMPYMGSTAGDIQKIWIGGVLRQSIKWEYGATTFTDYSGNGMTLTPSYRTDSSDEHVFVTLSAFGPVAESIAPPYALSTSTSTFFTASNMTGSFSTTVTPTFPGAAIFVDIAAAGGTPVQVPLMIVSCVVILIISLLGSWITRRFGNGNVIVKVIIILCMMGVLVGVGVFDFWMLMVFAILAIALAMASQQRGVA